MTGGFRDDPEDLATAAASWGEKSGMLQGFLRQMSETVESGKSRWKGGASDTFGDVSERWGEAMGAVQSRLYQISERFQQASAEYSQTDGDNAQNLAMNFSGDKFGDDRNNERIEADQPVDLKEKVPVKETPDDPPKIDDYAARPSSTKYPGVSTAQFEHVYGRIPQTDSEWAMASLMDTHTLVGRNNGVPARVTTGRINPVPGQGIVRVGLYIPSDHITNVPFNDLGDYRGPNEHFDPRSTRVALYIDYENGVVAARQNPSIATNGETQVLDPVIHVQQNPEGQLRIQYNGENPLAPPGSHTMGFYVNGDIALTPTPDGIRVDGQVGDFPSIEIYQDHEDVTASAYTYQASMSPLGPVEGLRDHHPIGSGKPEITQTYQQGPYWDGPGIEPHSTRVPIPNSTMTLGSQDADNIPSVNPVQPPEPSAMYGEI